MKKIVGVIATQAGAAHGRLAAEALRAEIVRKGHQFRVEIQDDNPVSAEVLAPSDIGEADLVLVAADTPMEIGRFAGKPVYETRTAAAIRHSRSVLEKALERLPAPVNEKPVASAAPAGPDAAAQPAATRRLVAITSCPTGIAHTFMAAEALKKAAAALGHEIRVETQGSVGAKNQLTSEEIAAADAVVIAADTNVDLARFTGKPLSRVSTKEAMHHGRKVIATALELPAPSAAVTAEVNGKAGPAARTVEQLKAERSASRTGAYKHLMTGVSHMLPVVVAGGLAIALAFAVGGIYAGDQEGTLAAALSQIGGGAAFQLIVAVLSGYIARSIADRPGLAPGLIGGLLAQQLGAGFLGGIASGFLAGYLTRFLANRIKLPDNLEGLKPVLILPFLSSIAVGLLMIFVIAPPVQTLLVATTNWLNGMRGANAGMLGIILGGMMAFDMGGPINKAAYTFAVGLLASKVYTPMAAVMAAGMTPPLGLALASLVARRRFNAEERKSGGAACVLGLSFITEGAIPFAASDPLRVIPALIIGAATTGALSMAAGVELLVPHGGIFALLIPGAVTHLVPYLGAIVAGTAATVVMLVILKRPQPAAAAAATQP